MAAAVMALLVLALPLTLSGWGTYNDLLGGDPLEELHEFLGNAFGAVVLAHIALVAMLSLLRRRNHALPMLTGRIEGAGPDLVPHNRVWLAALLLTAVLAFFAWQWQQSPRGLLPELRTAQDAAGRHGDDDD